MIWWFYLSAKKFYFEDRFYTLARYVSRICNADISSIRSLLELVIIVEVILSSTLETFKLKPFKDFNDIISKMKNIFQKSIVASCDIEKGTILELSHLSFKKPGDGIPASKYVEMIGRKTSLKIKENQKTVKINKKLIKEAHQSVGNAVLITSLTISFGFSVLCLSSFIPTILFGLFTSLAMIIAMLGVLITLPALLIKIKI